MTCKRYKAHVIIVNYKKASRLLLGLDSLMKQDCSNELNILVHDNSCDPDEFAILSSASQVYQFSLYRSDENLGYCKGVNSLARRVVDGSPIILMSPDIILESRDVIDNLVGILDGDPSVGIVATPQINDDGSSAEIARKFPTLMGQFRRRLAGAASNIEVDLVFDDDAGLMEVDWVQSSFLVVRSELWKQLNGLDQRYFIFMGDIDLCLRAWRAGLKVVVANILGVRADGIRASASSVIGGLLKYSVRVHLRDALLYYSINGMFRPRNRAEV